MEKLRILAVLLFMSLPALCADTSSLDDAVKLLDTRHLDASNVSKADEIVNKLLETNANDPMAVTLSSRITFIRAEDAKNDNDKRKLFNKGTELGKKAMELSPKSSEAAYWYGVNFGRNCEMQGVFTAMGKIGDIKKAFEKAVELDNTNVLAINGLAMFYHGVPGLFGGNIEKAEELLLQAAKLDPNYSLVFLDLAVVVKDRGRREEAKEYLKKVIKMENPTNKAAYFLYDKPEAIRLLKEMGN